MMNVKMEFMINGLIKRTILALLVMIFVSCEDSNDLPNRNFQLVWQDEFDGVTGDLPNASNWTYDIGTGQGGWGNQELQYYTNRPENVSLDGEGNLVITAIEENEPFEGSPYTSARIKTQGIRGFRYGRIEARLKTPFSQGLWPAFWMLGTDIEEVGWPQTGEIDIMELRGQEPSIISGTIHGPGYSAGESIGDDFELLEGRFDTKFHVFAIEWGPNFIDFFVDDRLYQSLTPLDLPEEAEWVFNDKDFFLILNVAVGGTFLGNPDETSRFPQTMIVDYVRAYELIQ